MAVSLRRRLAAGAPAPVFAALGRGGRAGVARLAPDPRLGFVDSPRHAGLLLVAGAVRETDRPALARVHDQMPHPRATLWWGATPVFKHGAAATVPADADPVPALVDLHRAVTQGTRDSEPDLLPDAPPAPWKGRGDFGQGGEGMMGGVPYGRPMAMTADDRRDGLALDAYTATFGPFLPMLPAGLALAVTLQGDVIQKAAVTAAPYAEDAEGAGAALRRVARMARLLGLPAFADRLLRTRDARRLAPRLRRRGVFAAIPPGLGVVGGWDVRARLAAACAVAAGRAPAPAVPHGARLGDVLPGLEWHEAVLVLNSFPDRDLARLCAGQAAA